MSAKLRRNFSGAYHARNVATTWRLVCAAPNGGPSGAQIIVRGADSGTAAAWRQQLTEVGIEWRDNCVLLTTKSGGQIVVVEAQAVIVHEAMPDLYAALPLAKFDGPTRRFWQRVLWVARIPGGRLLLARLARSHRTPSR